MESVCNNDCFNCKFEDCIVDSLTALERAEQNERDRDIVGYGRMSELHGTKRRTRYGRIKR